MKYPKYVKTFDGYVGTFSGIDAGEYGEFPLYRFPGGVRVADNWELRHGRDSIEELEPKGRKGNRK